MSSLQKDAQMDLKFYLIVYDEAQADTCNKPLKDTQAWQSWQGIHCQL
jgi:hypothetical protein